MNNSEQKTKTLAEVRELLSSGQLTPEELSALVPKPAHQPQGATHDGRSKTLGAALYVVGAVIVCSGLAVLIGQNWSELDTVSRVMFTFGLGVVFLCLGAYLKRVHKIDDMLSETALAIASVALVIGSGVIVHEAGFALEDTGTIASIALLLAAANALIYILLKSPVVAFTSLAMLVVFIQAFADVLFGGDMTGELFRYILMLNGAWLIAAGIFMQRRTVLHVISRVVQVFGAFFLLGMAMILLISATNSIDDLSGIIWSIVYPGLLGLVVYGSIAARSRGLLLSASVFLTLYILYISSEYFSDTFGWAFSLMIAGISIIAIAFGVRKINKQFFIK